MMLVKFLGSIAALAMLCPPAAGDDLPWRTHLGRALKEARASGRPLMVDVWATWCAPCKTMDATTYRDARVIAAAREFVPLKINADANELFYDRHRIEALPALLFLDGEGRELTRMPGLVEAEPAVETMRAVSAGYAAFLGHRTRLDDLESVRVSSAYLSEIGNHGAAAQLLRRAMRAMKNEAPAHREWVELWWAQARWADDANRAGLGTLQELSRDAASGEVRSAALRELIRIHDDLGLDAEARRYRRRLRDLPPGAAPQDTAGAGTP